MGLTVIIGRNEDPHTLAVKSALERLGQNVLVLDSFRGDKFHISLSVLQEQTGKLSISGVLGGEIESIWLRQKPVIPMPWWSPLQYDAAKFSQSEWLAVIQTLDEFLPSTYWINSPTTQRWINYKPNQLALAISVGFSVPDTVVTNDSSMIVELIERHRKIIYKSLSGYIFTDQTAILTSIIDVDTVKSNPESIKRAPGVYQQFITKAYEARVTVVGARQFVAFIKTPIVGPGAIDWRHNQFENIFEEGGIPENVAKCIARFQKAAKIIYGAYDFVISPEGIWYFLECNPAGQFLWLEQKLGHNISQAIAEELCYNKSVIQ